MLRFGDGAWLCELAPVRDPARVDDAVAAVFSVTATIGQGRLPRSQNPMVSRSSRTVPRPGWGSALRMSRRLMALGCP